MTPDDDKLPDVVRSVRERVQHCRDAPLEQAKEAFAAAMVQLIQARNRRLSSGRRPAAANDPELRQVNAILSLMASIEFPLAGLHRERMDKVADALERI